MCDAGALDALSVSLFSELHVSSDDKTIAMEAIEGCCADRGTFLIFFFRAALLLQTATLSCLVF